MGLRCMFKCLMLVAFSAIGIGLCYYFPPYVGVFAAVGLTWVFSNYLSIGAPDSVTVANEEPAEANQNSEQRFSWLLSNLSLANRQCMRDLKNVLTTQNSAVETLSQGLTAMQKHISSQYKLIENLTPEQQVLTDLSTTRQLIESNLNDAIRCLQFGDINSQNLTYTIETLELFTQLFESLMSVSTDIESAKQQFESLQQKRSRQANPVSSHTITAGSTELF